MPIYEYRCSACGYQNDYLQKHSDPLLSECPECGKSTLEKQVTAAGFQLKGTGWYATDFKNNGKSKSTPAKTETSAKTETPAKTESKSGGDSGSAAGDSGSKPEASTGGAGASPAGS